MKITGVWEVTGKYGRYGVFFQQKLVFEMSLMKSPSFFFNSLWMVAFAYVFKS